MTLEVADTVDVRFATGRAKNSYTFNGPMKGNGSQQWLYPDKESRPQTLSRKKLHPEDDDEKIAKLKNPTFYDCR